MGFFGADQPQLSPILLVLHDNVEEARVEEGHYLHLGKVAIEFPSIPMIRAYK